MHGIGSGPRIVAPTISWQLSESSPAAVIATGLHVVGAGGATVTAFMVAVAGAAARTKERSGHTPAIARRRGAKPHALEERCQSLFTLNPLTS